ncbi:MAG: hypothetical protein QNJ14_17715 [Woeseiaceae bacterium]|nr:hypothetical protein [Woeseiaceae bacterium]
MATAEKLLHEAYFAFNNVSYGETPDNKRNKRRATSLCRKILRKYPGTMEASEAHAILMRLGEEAYTSQLAVQHQHITQTAHHAPKPGDKHRHISQQEHHRPNPRQAAQTPMTAANQEVEKLNWAGLIGWLVTLPRFVLALILLGGFFLFGIFGPFLFVPLILLVLFTGPFRNTLKPEQRRQIDEIVAWVNRAIEEQRA